MLTRLVHGLAAAVSCTLLGLAVAALQPTAPPATEPAPAAASGEGARLYAQAQPSLFQVRVLNAASRTQQVLGSGFVIGAGGLAITNYHVVAAAILEPRRFVIEALAADGKRGDLDVLKVDVANDLALVRVRSPEAWPALQMDARPLSSGERLYALGNPKDLGFAMTQGSFSGKVARPLYPRIFYSGAINAGMSGGPTVDAGGRVIGINVQKRTDGEQLGFLIPVEFAARLAEGVIADTAAPEKAEFDAAIGEQLLRHQSLLADRMLAQPLPIRTLGPYRVPVNEAPGVRCWASGEPKPEQRYDTSGLFCYGEDNLFVAEGLYAGAVWIQHEYVTSKDLAPFQFTETFSKRFRADAFGKYAPRHWTGEECSDAFVEGAGGVPLRAVLCLRALRRFPGLFDVALVTASVDSDQHGVIMRMRAAGVSRASGERIVEAVLNGVGVAALETGQ